MKILVSGGWGYGNLGDDSILVASVHLLKEKYPSSEIVVTSYDCDQTCKVQSLPTIKIVPSVHRYLSGELAFKKLSTWRKSYNFCKYPKLFRRIVSRFQRYFLRCAESRILRKYEELSANLSAVPTYNEFQSADLFVMSGGGYFNSWLDNLCARVIELKMARQMNLKSLIIGQSIGPFKTTELSELAYCGLRLADMVSVRDTESWNEMRSLGIDCNIAPDLALSDIRCAHTTTEEIAIIPGELSLQYMQVLCDALLNASQILHCTYKLLLTRLYNADIVCARQLHKLMTHKGLTSKLIIPNNYGDIQTELAHSRAVVSRTLHGLILGWRSGVPSVCLNNERKCLSFMAQSRQSDRVLGLHEMTESRVTKAIIEAYNTVGTFDELRADLSNKVKQNFFSCLDKVMQIES
jgi:polysaccharide pyruvyl transferase WcaK-like protein